VATEPQDEKVSLTKSALGRRFRATALKLGILISSLVNCLPARAVDLQRSHVLVCGSAQVLEGVIEGGPKEKSLRTVWRWRPEESRGLPLILMSRFAGTDECKPVSGGQELLITSSGGALALVDHKTGDTLFYAVVPNAHSAALLPDGFVVAASSFASGEGNRFLLYHRSRSDQPIVSLIAHGAHGVEWDDQRNVLWALADSELLRIHVIRSMQSSAKMTIERSYPLPGRGGHDLLMDHHANVLYVTTADGVFVFNPQQQQFSSPPLFRGVRDVKSISIDPVSGQIAYTTSAWGVWWTYQLFFKKPDAVVTLSEHAYKVRWYTPPFTTLLQSTNTVHP
jgi:hypothetical protein